MARVLGIGGVFRRTRSHLKLRRFYSRWLGVRVGSAGAMFQPSSMPKGSLTVLGIFPAAARYFSPSRASLMLNFVVDDVDAMLKRAADCGGRVAGKARNHPYGRFGWFIDPDDTKVELWQPPAPKRRASRRAKSR
jgi:predicted enzyme related to lactoylglutathione lyase